MPGVYPGTGMTLGVPPLPSRPRPDAETVSIREAIRAVLDGPSQMPPPAVEVAVATDMLRRFVMTKARTLQDAVKTLDAKDPRREAVEEVAEEGLYRATELGPGDGLLSAYAYARALAQSARALLGQVQRLELLAGSAGVVVTDAADAWDGESHCYPGDGQDETGTPARPTAPTR
ncbi:DUF6415 family natural product biosynthesis protein [Streptomyces gamaensis]|uniref:DUF6415 family natural product biosynthesis protein n=1 Tax=Streptomyces gamaensis TaxID=1763542 RepID=A0ABW0YYZ1_9ACTN